MRLLGTDKELTMHLDSHEWSAVVDIIEAVYGIDILGEDALRNLRYAYGEPVGGQQLEKLGTAIEQFIEDNELERVDMGHYNSISITRIKEFITFIRDTKEFTMR